jgi:hypothetical protein
MPQSRDFAAWGLEYRHQNGSDLILTTPDLTITGFAGTSTTRSGSVSTNVYRGTLTTSPVAVCGISNQPHVGTYRPYVRVWASGSAVTLRLTYREGDGPFKSLSWEVPAAAGAWCEIDLGVITIPPKLLGTQRWAGQIEAYSSTPGDTLDVDYVILMPCGEGYGRARRLVTYETSTTFVARDEFAQTTGNLAGKVLPSGQTWTALAGSDPDDFTVNATADVIQRTAIGPEGPRIDTAGTMAYGAVAVQADMTQAVGTASGANFGVAARVVDISNYMAAYVRGFLAIEGPIIDMEMLVGGVDQAMPSIRLPGRRALGQWITIRLLVETSGFFAVWGFDASGKGGTPLLAGWHSALATGGALDDGMVGVFAQDSSNFAHTNYLRRWSAFVPTANAVCFAGQSLEFRWDDTIREDSTGTYWGRPQEYRGAPFFIPPAGDENRTSRVAVMMRRNDPYTLPNANVTDNQTVEVKYTPRYLYLPR